MTVRDYVFEGAVLTGAAVTQGPPVPALTTRKIIAATLTNTTGAAVAATVHLVPSGGAAGAATTQISARTIAPGETYFCPELINQGLLAGGVVQALGAGVTFRYAAKDTTT